MLLQRHLGVSVAGRSALSSLFTAGAFQLPAVEDSELLGLWNQPHVTAAGVAEPTTRSRRNQAHGDNPSDPQPLAQNGTNYTCSLAGRCTALTRSGTGGADGHSVRPRRSASTFASG